ncbi:MAG: hypothetical protein OXS29_10800 [bacterium]|nr:hypothetical protein [bacterium]MDE0287689.1 hypothetical protein [bacterium]MDE0438202.1 hypothetical protein [bacterium]
MRSDTYAGAALRHLSDSVGTMRADGYFGTFEFEVVDAQFGRQAVQILCEPRYEVVRFVRPGFLDPCTF